MFIYIQLSHNKSGVAQLAGAREYTDCISARG